MSNNRKNFHYHYAEQYETKAERRERRREIARRRSRFAVAPAALLPAVILLVLLGLMSTAFSSYLSAPESSVSYVHSGSQALSQLRNSVDSKTVSRVVDLTSSGSDSGLSRTGAAADLASTGWYNTYVLIDKDSFAQVSSRQLSGAVGSVYIDFAALGYSMGDDVYFRFYSEGNNFGSWSDNYVLTNTNYGTKQGSTANFKHTFTNSLKMGFYIDGNNGTPNVNCWEESLTGPYSSSGDFYLYNNIVSVSDSNRQAWFNHNSAPQMVQDTTDTSLFYYDFYLKKNEYDTSDYFSFRIWSSQYKREFGPSSTLTFNSSTTSSTNVTAYSGGTTSNCYKFDTSILDPDCYYRVRVKFDVDYSTTGQISVEYNKLTNLSPNLSVTTFTAQAVYDLTDTTSYLSYNSGVGSVTMSYEFSSDNSSWSPISTPETWTAPSAGTYYIRLSAHDNGVVARADQASVNTATQNALTSRTETNTITITTVVPQVCAVYADGSASETFSGKNVNEHWSVEITASAAHTADGDITVTVDPLHVNYLAVCATENGTYSNQITGIRDGDDIWIKALRPTTGLGGSAEITAACAAGDVGSIGATIEVTVSDPVITNTVATLSLYYDATVDGSVSSSPAGSIVYDTSLYTSNNGTDSAYGTGCSVNASTGLITIGNYASNAGTAYMKYTVTYPTGYSVSAYREVTINARPTCALRGLNQAAGNAAWSLTDNMVYKSGGTYEIKVFLQGKSTYGANETRGNSNQGYLSYSDSNTYGFKLFYNSTWKANSGLKITGSNCTNIDVSSGGGGNNMSIETGDYGGYYTFTYNPSTDKLTVTYPSEEKYYLVGFKNVWPSGFIDGTHDPEDYEITVDNEGNGTVTESFDAAEADAFKIYCTHYNKYWGLDNHTIGHDTDLGSGYHLYDDNNDCHFNAWYSGEYTFTFSGLDDVTHHSLDITSITAPSRNVTANPYIGPATDTLATQPGGDYHQTFRNNWNDTWTVITKAPEADDFYTFSNWNSVGQAGVTTSSNGVYETTVTVTNATPVEIRSYWNHKSYSLTLHTYGATLPLTNLSGTTGAVTTSGSGDTLCYIYNYTYGTAVTLPDDSDFSVIDSTWDFQDWTANSDMSGATQTSISNTSSGPIELWPKISISVDFIDNLVDAPYNGISSQTVLWGADAVVPSLGTGSGELNVNKYNGFTVDTTSASTIWSSTTAPQSVKTGQTIYAIYRPITETSPAIQGTFTPNTNVNTSTVNIGGVDNTLFEIGFGSVLQADFVQKSSYTSASAPEGDIVYKYVIAANADPDISGGYTNSMTKSAGLVDGMYEWTGLSSNIATMMTKPTSVSPETGEYGYVTIKFKASFTDKRGQVLDALSGSQLTIYYSVITPFTGISVSPTQRIYMDSSLSGTKPDVDANFTSYSSDITNVARYKVEVSGSGITTAGTGLIPDGGNNYKAVLKSYLTDFLTKGVKDYTIQFKQKDGDNWVTDYTATAGFHTTVGTNDSTGQRPLYFAANGDCTGFGLMAFYFDSSSNLVIQTAESFSRSGQSESVYRFNIPTGDVNVTFALVNITAEMNGTVKYALPDVYGTSLDFQYVIGTSGMYYRAVSAPVAVSNSVQTVSATGVSGTTLSCSTDSKLG